MHSVVNRSVAKLKNINHGCRHFMSLGFYYNTFYITESTTNGCNEQNLCGKEHKRTVHVSVADASDGVMHVAYVTSGASLNSLASVWINKHLNRLFGQIMSIFTTQ